MFYLEQHKVIGSERTKAATRSCRTRKRAVHVYCLTDIMPFLQSPMSGSGVLRIIRVITAQSEFAPHSA